MCAGPWRFFWLNDETANVRAQQRGGVAYFGSGRSVRENHATTREPTTRERAIGKGRFIVSLRMGFIFCFRESTSIHADESIAPLAGARGSDKTYLFFVDFRYGANRWPDSMLLKPTGFPEKRACGSERGAAPSCLPRIS